MTSATSGTAAVAASGTAGAATPRPQPRLAFQVAGLHRSHAAVRRGRRGAAPEPVRAVDGVDLDVPAGEVFGLLGPNGAGKTTLVRLLTGLLRPAAGSISLFGHDLVAHPDLAAGFIAYLAQEEPALDELPVAVAVATTGRLRGLPRGEATAATGRLLDELGLSALASRPLLRLSGGQRRLALLATALVGDRPVLVLDEPTTGLDPVARRAAWDAITRRRDELGTTVLLVTHNVLEAEAVLDRVAVLEAGRVIACDRPERLKAQVGEDVRLDLVWRDEPPLGVPVVAGLAGRARIDGRRWSVRLPREAARDTLAQLTAGPGLAALDDVTLATPTLEDVYLALGGRARDLERS